LETLAWQDGGLILSPGADANGDIGARHLEEWLSMRLTCLVDNAVQPRSAFWGEHGLAYLVEVDGQRILFDTGQSGAVLEHNLKLLGVDPVTIDAVAISHAHYDHTGGLPALLGRLRPAIPLFANADLFRQRFAQRDGPPKRIGLTLSLEELAARFALKLSAAPQEIAPGVWTTGEIGERTEFEGRSQEHLMASDGEPVADAYRDDMALVLQAGDRLALLCGCCHAGLLNTLGHVERTFLQPASLIIGGLHLAGVADDDVRRVSARLAAMSELPRVYAGHCTGEAVFLALAQSLGTAIVRSSPAGTVIEIG
jgi:7,8-dihydropterin-6-yl-methyl-4-(beta-D-ribofuranosyl)aminobenzene 5'-phosphate synthase